MTNEAAERLLTMAGLQRLAEPLDAVVVTRRAWESVAGTPSVLAAERKAYAQEGTGSVSTEQAFEELLDMIEEMLSDLRPEADDLWDRANALRRRYRPATDRISPTASRTNPAA